MSSLWRARLLELSLKMRSSREPLIHHLIRQRRPSRVYPLLLNLLVYSWAICEGSSPAKADRGDSAPATASIHTRCSFIPCSESFMRAATCSGGVLAPAPAGFQGLWRVLISELMGNTFTKGVPANSQFQKWCVLSLFASYKPGGGEKCSLCNTFCPKSVPVKTASNAGRAPIARQARRPIARHRRALRTSPGPLPFWAVHRSCALVSAPWAVQPHAKV